MRLKSKDSVAFLRSKGFQDISTGGGCVGWYLKKGDYTYYATVYSELTLPTKYGQQVSVGVYDSDFNKQFISYDIKTFIPSKLMLRINTIERKMKSKSIKSELERSQVK